MVMQRVRTEDIKNLKDLRECEDKEYLCVMKLYEKYPHIVLLFCELLSFNVAEQNNVARKGKGKVSLNYFLHGAFLCSRIVLSIYHFFLYLSCIVKSIITVFFKLGW
jgi:hypothetical protein